MIHWKKIDLYDIPWRILIIAIILTLIGLLALKSISYHHTKTLQNPFYKQVIFLLPSIVLCGLILFLPRYAVHKYSFLIYGAGIVLVILPFLDSEHAGTHRWLNVGLPFAVQPSEFAKIFTVIALARYLSDHTLKMKRFSSIIVPFILVLVPSVIVLNQPDLGTAIIMLTPILPMLYWSGSRPFYLFMILAPILSILTAFDTTLFAIWAIVMGSLIFIAQPKMSIGMSLFFGNIFLGLLSRPLWEMLKPYQQNRLITMLYPEKDPLGAAYQIIQSKTAIGSGGLLGKGWGAGTQTHLKFLPVQESDFILSVIGEELGFVTIAFILILFGYLINQILKYSFLSRDRFSSLVLIGIATILMSHVFVNTAMTVGLIPVKGLPFPFISAGGSFLMTSYIMTGLVMRLSIHYSD